MWQCPRCETINEEMTCIICGEEKPKFESKPQQQSHQVRENSYDYSGTPEKKKSKAGVIVLVLFIIIFAIIGAYIYLDGQYNKAESAYNRGEYEYVKKLYEEVQLFYQDAQYKIEKCEKKIEKELAE